MARNTKRISRRKKKSVKRRGGKRGNNAFKNALQKLSSLHPSQRTQAMKMANTKFVRQFCQKVKSLRTARISPAVQSKLRRKSKVLRKLIAKKTSLRKKQDMLSQRGGGLLGILVPALISAITASLRK
ncbi:MAG: hypothetical protein AAFN63_16920 [Pseudomonadota bacterium]